MQGAVNQSIVRDEIFCEVGGLSGLTTEKIAAVWAIRLII
jgi:hypothetical protein